MIQIIPSTTALSRQLPFLDMLCDALFFKDIFLPSLTILPPCQGEE